MISSLSSQTDLKGTLLTRQQVDEISDRISKRVSESVSKQLEEAISMKSPKEKKAGKRKAAKKD